MRHRLWKLWDQSTLFARESLFRRARRDACFDCFDDRVYYGTSDSGNNEEANRRTERGCAAMGLRRHSGRHYECTALHTVRTPTGFIGIRGLSLGSAASRHGTPSGIRTEVSILAGKCLNHKATPTNFFIKRKSRCFN